MPICLSVCVRQDLICTITETEPKATGSLLTCSQKLHSQEIVEKKKINSRATWRMMFLRSIIWRPALSLNQALWHRTVTFVTAAGALSCYCSHLEAAAIEMKWTLDFLGSAWVPLYMLAWSSLRNEHVSHVCSSIKVKMGLVLTPFCDYGREHGHEEPSW